MEFKDYVRMLKRHKKLFWGIWGILAIVVFGWYFSRPVSYEATMSIDIARKGSREVPNEKKEYDYDQYYRLEADDLFADTVTKWLKDPGVVNSIYADSKLKVPGDSLRKLSATFTAEKLAPNYVQVEYDANNPDDAGRIYRSTRKVITDRTNALNADSQDQNWFKVMFSGPVVAKKSIPFLPVLVAIVAGGFLVAVFGVLVKHYWEE